jgi:hypothetical protein
MLSGIARLLFSHEKAQKAQMKKAESPLITELSFAG